MISAIVPTCGGFARLARHLPSVARSLAEARRPWEIVVVDDGGGGIEALPVAARVERLSATRGYGPAVNRGARVARGELLLVLNDDVELEPPTVGRLLGHFPDPGLFAVAPAILSPLAACGDEGGKRPRWRAGEIEIHEAPSTACHSTLYPVGCCFLCPREAFLDLGGFDDAYAPFFWEDVELGYRAWRRGLRCLHEPAAVVRHEGSATLRERHAQRERERVSFRNRALFHLRMLQAPGLRAESLGAWAARLLFEAEPARLLGIGEALERFRGRPALGPGLDDGAILEQLSS